MNKCDCSLAFSLLCLILLTSLPFVSTKITADNSWWSGHTTFQIVLLMHKFEIIYSLRKTETNFLTTNNKSEMNTTHLNSPERLILAKYSLWSSEARPIFFSEFRYTREVLVSVPRIRVKKIREKCHTPGKVAQARKYRCGRRAKRS